jgi:hypothetical protein
MHYPVTEVLTGLLVVITGIYAALTFGILRAARASVAAVQRQTEELARPHITVAPVALPRNFILFLRISNTGRTAAQNLRLELDRPFQRLGRPGSDDNIASLSAFTSPIASFAPGSELIFSLATGPQLFGPDFREEVTPLVFKVTATYAFGSRTVSEATEVDLRPFRGMHMSFDPLIDELHEIAEQLKQLKDVVGRS